MTQVAHHPGRRSEQAPRSGRWPVLVLLGLAQFMVILDVSVVNVALPQMAGDLGLSRTGATWAVTAYTLFFGGLMLLGGRLADQIGRRTVFLAGLVVFTGASLAAAAATGTASMVTARALQGVGAALLSPAALSILTTVFQGRERHRALAVWGAIGGGGAAVGVLAGGLLVAGPGWEWVFLVNLPVGVTVGLLTLMLVPRRLPGAAERTSGRVDAAGPLLVTAATGLLIYGVVHAGDAGWSDATTLGAIASSVILYGLFGVVERRRAHPLVDLRILGQRPLVAGTIVMLAASALLIAGFFLTSLVLQTVRQMSALQTGVAFLPVAVATVAGAHVAGRLVGRIGPRPLVSAAFGLSAVGLTLLAGAGTGARVWTGIVPSFVLVALGLGAGFVAATTTAMSRVDVHHAGVAAGTVNTAHELGAALGVATASAIVGSTLGAGAAAAGTAGFTAAYAAGAIVAAAMAVAGVWLLPPGRPAASNGPVFVH
jgi:EmrB/QacA subfamily drug resistance transporter